MKLTMAMASLALLASTALAQERLFEGTRTLGDQSLSTSAWGSGIISATDEAAFNGTLALRVSSRNFFQGGQINFGKPVDLSGKYAGKENLLLLIVKLADGTTTTTAGGGRAGAPGAGGAGGLGAGDGEGGPGAGRGGSSQGTPAAPVTKRIRLVITTTDGMKSEAFLDLADTNEDSRGWRRVGLPLQAITGFSRTNKTIQSIAVATSESMTFLLGEIQILDDTTPLYAEPINSREMNIGSGDQVTFQARASGGATKVVYQWDFDAADGLQVDAEGRQVRFRFRKPGTFTVTLTVRDAYGLKTPYSTTLKVVVN